MKVVLVKASSRGRVGQVLSHPTAWRLAFPVKGCVAKPVDAEAVEAVENDIASVHGSTRERLLVEMANSGTWPVNAEVVKPAESPDSRRQKAVNTKETAAIADVITLAAQPIVVTNEKPKDEVKSPDTVAVDANPKDEKPKAK